MHVSVDTALCQGYANCLLAAPDVFDLDDLNLALVKQEPTDDMRPAVEEAARSCPVAAITVED